MPIEFQYDVFLSHSAKDKSVVRTLAERLQTDGLKVWFDEWVLKPGDSIPAKIEDGLEHSHVLVLCMSANAFGSDWAQLEAGTFRFRDPLNKERRFIPLRLDDTPITGSLAQFLYIDWRLEYREQEYAKLLVACKTESGTQVTIALGQETATPAFPELQSAENTTPEVCPRAPRDVVTAQYSLRPIGEAWSGLRGLMEQAYSTKTIKGIIGRAGLPVSEIHYTGTYKGPVLDEADRLVRMMDEPRRDCFVIGCIKEITSFERDKATIQAAHGNVSSDRTLRDLRQVIARFGHDLSQYQAA